MNIEPDIFDYLETTSLEPHDDYTSEISYKDQKIILNRLKAQQNEIERLNNKIKEQNLLLIEFQDMEQKLDIYKSRIDKAIKYINKLSNEPNAFGHYGIDYRCKDWLLNILKGSDENATK